MARKQMIRRSTKKEGKIQKKNEFNVHTSSKTYTHLCNLGLTETKISFHMVKRYEPNIARRMITLDRFKELELLAITRPDEAATNANQSI